MVLALVTCRSTRAVSSIVIHHGARSARQRQPWQVLARRPAVAPSRAEVRRQALRRCHRCCQRPWLHVHAPAAWPQSQPNNSPQKHTAATRGVKVMVTLSQHSHRPIVQHWEQQQQQQHSSSRLIITGPVWVLTWAHRRLTCTLQDGQGLSVAACCTDQIDEPPHSATSSTNGRGAQ